MTDVNQTETTMPRAGVQGTGDLGEMLGTYTVCTEGGRFETRDGCTTGIRQTLAEGETVVPGTEPTVCDLPSHREDRGGDSSGSCEAAQRGHDAVLGRGELERVMQAVSRPEDREG